MGVKYFLSNGPVEGSDEDLLGKVLARLYPRSFAVQYDEDGLPIYKKSDNLRDRVATYSGYPEYGKVSFSVSIHPDEDPDRELSRKLANLLAEDLLAVDDPVVDKIKVVELNSTAVTGDDSDEGFGYPLMKEPLVTLEIPRAD